MRSFEAGNEDWAKMVAGRVDTKPAEAIPDDREARKYWLYRSVRSGNGPITRLKIRCPKGRAGSTPALRTTYHNPIAVSTDDS
jgi:hypothetical protein